MRLQTINPQVIEIRRTAPLAWLLIFMTGLMFTTNILGVTDISYWYVFMPLYIIPAAILGILAALVILAFACLAIYLIGLLVAYGIGVLIRKYKRWSRQRKEAAEAGEGA